MLSFRKTLGFVANLAFISVLLFSLVLGPSLRRATIINTALLAEIRGCREKAIELLIRALDLFPDDSRIRWQAGVALARAGNSRVAARIMLPMTQQDITGPVVLNAVLTVFLDSGWEEEALRAYESADESQLYLTSTNAAKLATNYIDETGGLSITLSRFNQLLSQALGMNAPSLDFALLSEKLVDESFWSTDIAERLYDSLVWRGRNAVPADESNVSMPNKEYIAELLKIKVSDIFLGEELVTNGMFEQHINASDTPVGWKLSFMTDRSHWNRAVFVVGTDSNRAFNGNYSLRIDGVYVEQQTGRAPARAGLWHGSIKVAVGEPYVISFVFRTEQTSDRAASLWISAEPDFFGERFLPNTGGDWRRATIVVWSKDEIFAPLLRLWREGKVWFDDFSIRPIILDQGIRGPIVEDILMRIDEAE
jgi:hypothetical protein